MQNNVNQSKPKRIYDKQTRQWFEVTPEQYSEHDRWRTRIRKKQQKLGFCNCPRSKWWLCDGICEDCEFRCTPGNIVSLDTPIDTGDGDEMSLHDVVADPDSLFESAICDKAELDELFKKLSELMPEAVEIGKLRQKGLSDEAIAKMIGIKRTTFLSRLKKAKERLAEDYPDRF